MLRFFGVWVLFTACAVAVAVGVTEALELGHTGAFFVGLVCGCPAGIGALCVALERDWL